MRDLRRVLDARTAQDGDLPPTLATFLRGLSLGALVGAAVAGTLLLQRRREQRPLRESTSPGRARDA